MEGPQLSSSEQQEGDPETGGWCPLSGFIAALTTRSLPAMKGFGKGVC
jgi:hypothetical protein